MDEALAKLGDSAWMSSIHRTSSPKGPKGPRGPRGMGEIHGALRLMGVDGLQPNIKEAGSGITSLHRGGRPA